GRDRLPGPRPLPQRHGAVPERLVGVRRQVAPGPPVEGKAGMDGPPAGRARPGADRPGGPGGRPRARTAGPRPGPPGAQGGPRTAATRPDTEDRSPAPPPGIPNQSPPP